MPGQQPAIVSIFALHSKLSSSFPATKQSLVLLSALRDFSG